MEGETARVIPFSPESPARDILDGGAVIDETAPARAAGRSRHGEGISVDLFVRPTALPSARFSRGSTRERYGSG
jgi:hypothetical protein